MNDKIELEEYPFESQAYKILPGITDYYCEIHKKNLKSDFPFYTKTEKFNDPVHIKDIFIEENRFFKYHLIKPAGLKITKKIVFLFHGFNEKNWKKYLPWAETICRNTKNSVVLFPIAFHMQRAPEHWSNKREMYKLSEQRKKNYPNILKSSLSNVAISMRLHSIPQRFIWSGLQTYYDVIQFIENCKKGFYTHISNNFEFNIFAYSIGGFLAQILKLANHKNYFNHTKVCLFCSGATFNLLSPVSKFILDSEANATLHSFFVEHFDEILQKDRLLNHYINENHLEGKIFYSMLDYEKMKNFREKLLKKYENQIYAITLKKDNVIPSTEVIKTLKGDDCCSINIKVDELDFNREYTHEDPFPANSKYPNKVAKDFDRVFKKICDFFLA